VKTYRLIRKQVLETDILAAWQFFSDPSNLRLITPPWLDFRITSPVSGSVYAGLIRRKLDEIFDYRNTALKKIFPPAT
jgi:hypothetical protein